MCEFCGSGPVCCVCGRGRVLGVGLERKDGDSVPWRAWVADDATGETLWEGEGENGDELLRAARVARDVIARGETCPA